MGLTTTAVSNAEVSGIGGLRHHSRWWTADEIGLIFLIQFTIYSLYGFQLAIAVLVFIYLLHWVNLIPALAFVYSHICYTGLT